MKRALCAALCASLALALAAAFWACGVPEDVSSAETVESTATESSTSTEEQALNVVRIATPYAGVNGNAIWDMKVFDGYLYIGAGDYDKNLTVQTAYRLSLATEKWEACGNIPDEQISRFVELDGQLVLPGIDPTDNWNYGNYYVLDGDSFRTVREIPNAVHTFDIVSYEGCYFYGIGVTSGSPVVMREKDSRDYSPVPFFGKDGQPVSTAGRTAIRAYDLFALESGLYAYAHFDEVHAVYRFDGAAFQYYSDYSRKLVYGGFTYVPIPEKVTVGDTVYFTTGLLYATEDMKNLRDITPSGIDYVADLLSVGDQLLVLANRRRSNGAYDAVLLGQADDGTFSELFSVESRLPAMSFAYADGRFYIGVGKADANTKVASRILRVDYAL